MVVGGVIVVVLSIVLGNWRTAPYRAIEEARLKEQEAPPAPPPVPAPAPFTAPAPAPSGPLTVADAVELAGPNGVVCPTDPVVDGARARLELATDGARVTLALHDDGQGMTEVERDKALDPFFSTKASGTGLGLAITKQILEDHGGTVEIAPSPLGGTTVTLVLAHRTPSTGRVDAADRAGGR